MFDTHVSHALIPPIGGAFQHVKLGRKVGEQCGVDKLKVPGWVADAPRSECNYTLLIRNGNRVYSGVWVDFGQLYAGSSQSRIPKRLDGVVGVKVPLLHGFPPR